MSPEWVAIGLTAIGMVAAALVSAVVTSWGLSRKLSNRPTFSQVKDGLDGYSERVDRAAHDYGEALSAIRRKVEEFEFWARDNLGTSEDVKENRQALREVNKRLEDLSSISVKVDTMWEFMMDRAKIEAKEKGYMKKNSPFTLTEEGLRAIQPILPDVKAYCLLHPNLVTMSIDQLEIELARTFRQRLLDEICEPNHIYMGACIVMMMEALRLEKIIPTLVAA